MLINGRNLHVECHGLPDSPAIVLLHHGLGSVRAWAPQVPVLAAAGWRVVVYDRWGYGKSDPRPALSVPHFRDDLEDLEALLEAFDLERAAMLGHSDGGTIALHFAASRPERISCLVTVAAHIYVEPKMERGIESLRKVYESDPRFRRAFCRVHGDKSEAVFLNWYNGWCRSDNLNWDMRPALRRIACPILVVQGLEDEHATPQHAQDIAEAIQDAELWLLPGAGHMLPQEVVEDFNRRVVDYLKLSADNGMRDA